MAETTKGGPAVSRPPHDIPGQDSEPTTDGTISRYPPAFASVYAPCVGRAQWLAVYQCPHCHAGHSGRARRFEDLPGLRRSRCGRLVWLVVARTYRGRP